METPIQEAPVRTARSLFLHSRPRGRRFVGLAAVLVVLAFLMALRFTRVAQGERPEIPEEDPSPVHFGPAGCSQIAW